MTVNPSGWRPTTPANEPGEAQTVTGNRALMLEEPLIFEIDRGETTGVDFDCVPAEAGTQAGPRPSPGNCQSPPLSDPACQSRTAAALPASARDCR